MAQCLTFNSKTTDGPKISLWPFSKFFGLNYLPLNSGACRKITLGTLTLVHKFDMEKVITGSANTPKDSKDNVTVGQQF